MYYNLSSKVVVTYSVVPRYIFVLLNPYGHPNIEPKVCKKILEQLRSSFFWANLDILHSYVLLYTLLLYTLHFLQILTQAWNLVEGLQFHSSTQQKTYVPLCPKKLWVQDWLKFISGSCNVCETMSSFIKNLRHVVRKNPLSGLRFKHENIVFTNTNTQQKFCG